MLLVTVAALVPLPANAAEPTTAPEASAAAGAADAAPVVSFPVSKFVVSYGRENRNHPPLEELAKIEIALVQTPAGYAAAPAAGSASGGAAAPTAAALAQIRLPLGQEFKPPAVFQGSAIHGIDEAIVRYFNARGLLGVSVAPAEEDINPATLDDLRPAGQTELRLVIWTGKVTQVRSLALGERISPDQRVNNPAHQRIVANSPIRPGEQPTSQPGGQPGVGVTVFDLLDRDLMDNYIYFLNRHPGRRVDASISSASQPGEVSLDYLVAENKTKLAFAEVTNTGTKQTGEWRQRFGYVDNQFSNNDDLFSVEYITSCFQEEANAVQVSYEAPMGKLSRLRYRLYGGYSQYTASDLGIQNVRFSGDDTNVGGELIWNVYQHKQFFVDLIAGLTYRHIEGENESIHQSGDSNFLLPHVGVRAERMTDKDSLWGLAMVEGNINHPVQSELDRLGRANTDARWAMLKWDTGATTYLEPLFTGQPGSQGKQLHTLAHEVAVLFRGQWAGNYRLVPNMEQVAGGLYTVRGYPESAAAGDTALIGTAEYRFHIPRALKIEPNPSKTPLFGHPFRYSPQEEFGQADWDLIAKAFFDIGRTADNRFGPGESDATLESVGLGLELKVKQNLSVRVDWGVPLRGLESAEVKAGDSRVHFALMVVW